jgi:hypothetical protein
MADLKLKLDSLTDSVAKQAQDNQTLVTMNVAITNENKSLTEENRKGFEALAEERKHSNDLATANAQLKSNLEATQAKLTASEEVNSANAEIFAELARRNIEAGIVIAKLNSQPLVTAKVLDVNATTDLVILNVGLKQQVRKNFEFSIYRDSRYVATVNVFDVQEEMCAARIVRRNLPVQRGDDATTRL